MRLAHTSATLKKLPSIPVETSGCVISCRERDAGEEERVEKSLIL